MFGFIIKVKTKKAKKAEVKTLVNPKLQFNGGHYRRSKGVTYLSLYSLLMVDWDPVKDGESADEHYTVCSKGEVLDILNEDIERNPSHLWKIYETPSGGIHAFLISHSLTPKEGSPLLTALKGDGLYRKMCLRRGVWSVRVSPKKGRKGDFIARFLEYKGHGEMLAENQEAIDIHDSFLIFPQWED